MNICQNIISGSQLFPDSVALIFESGELTYADLERLSGHAAQRLLDLGVDRGDRVGIVIGNVPAFVVWYYAVLRVGAIAVSINTRLTGEEVAFILADCAADVLIGTADTLPTAVAHLPSCVAHQLEAADDGRHCDRQPLAEGSAIASHSFAEMEPDAPATILYTSGTTGFPKGATLSHQNVRATVHAFNHLCEMRVGDRLLLAVPLFHCFGQNALLNSGLNVGATIVMQRRFDLNESKQLIRRQRVNRLFGVPTMFQLMLDACTREDLSTIEYCFSAAATLPPQVATQWQETFGMPIYEGYGLTETAPFASYNHRLKFKPGSIGVPVDLVEMKIIDPATGQDCPPDVPGEIAIRGPNVMLGYWNRPEDTEAAIRDGWFMSGDIGTMDDQGYFFIVDRLKDMIAVGGLKVFPAEVERVLLDHPDIADVAVVGHEDHIWGEKVVASIVPRPNSTPSPESIRTFGGQHLAAYKVPAEILLTGQLPRNPAGKVLKTELRQQLDALLAKDSGHEITGTSPGGRPSATAPRGVEYSLLERLGATHPAGRERVLTAYLQDEIRLLTERDAAPAADALLMETDMDSLMMVTLAERVQTQVGSNVRLSPTLAFDHPRIADLAKFLLTELESESRPPKATATAQSATRPIQKTPSASSAESIDSMSEQQALEALLREIDE